MSVSLLEEDVDEAPPGPTSPTAAVLPADVLPAEVSRAEVLPADVLPADVSRAEVLPAEAASPRRFAFSAESLVPRIYDAIVVVWLAVFHHVLGVKYRFAQIAYDEHYFLTEGWSVLKGQIPYRDFQEFKPPVIFFVHALGLELFGLEDLGYRNLLSILSLVGFLAVAVALLSRRIHRVLVVAALMLMIDHFYDDGLHNAVINDAETLALDFFMLGAGVLLIRTKWERTQQVLGGVLLALSPLSKEPMAFAVVAAWLSLLVLLQIESGRQGAVWRFVLFTTVGVAGVLATWLVYMLATDSLGWYILQLKLSIAYTENYAYQLKWTSRSPRGGVLLDTLWRLAKGYANPAHFAVFIPFFVPLLMKGKHRIVGFGALATLAAALYAASVGRGFAPRYFIMAMTGTFFCVVLGAIALDAYSKRSSSVMARWAVPACMALAMIVTFPRFYTESRKYGTYAAQPPPVPQSDIDFVHAHTSPGDKIWTTDDPLLYVYSDRLSAFRGGIVLDEIIEYYPGNTDEERLSVIREGLEENRPKLVVFGNTQVGARRKRRYTQALVMPFLRDNGYIRLNDRFYVRPD
jgi:hypothetical protein